MAKQEERMRVLAKKLRHGIITDPEKKEFEEWYSSFNDTIANHYKGNSRNDVKERIYINISERAGLKRRLNRQYPLWPKVLAAASVIAVIGGLFFLNGRLKVHPLLSVSDRHTVIQPGSNQAVLILASGRKVSLNGIKSGLIAHQGTVTVSKNDEGQLSYNNANQNSVSAAENTLQTPRGGQYHLTLSDGSQIWLNASSSISFPVSFKGAARREVQITGEAYFEVAKDKLHPFAVRSGNQTVEVLGTHFNINSYADEPSVSTTLLEGSVKVSDNSSGKMGLLKPGQECIHTGPNIVIQDADTEEAIAWKNGYFMFSGEGITSIMRKLSRWYDVDIIYNGTMPTDKFEGTINRFASVQQVLKKLELTDRVHFKIIERRIIVSQ
jgi:transmembrane sensor